MQHGGAGEKLKAALPVMFDKSAANFSAFHNSLTQNNEAMIRREIMSFLQNIRTLVNEIINMGNKFPTPFSNFLALKGNFLDIA